MRWSRHGETPEMAGENRKVIDSFLYCITPPLLQAAPKRKPPQPPPPPLAADHCQHTLTKYYYAEWLPPPLLPGLSGAFLIVDEGKILIWLLPLLLAIESRHYTHRIVMGKPEPGPHTLRNTMASHSQPVRGASHWYYYWLSHISELKPLSGWSHTPSSHTIARGLLHWLHCWLRWSERLSGWPHKSQYQRRW